MEFINQCISLFLHLDTHLSTVIASFGVWTYVLLFIIIFCETGLVVTPFLPGDSLLFAAGAFAAKGDLHIALLFLLFAAAAIIGDSVNYAIGKFLGPQVFERKMHLIKREHLMKAHVFYEKHGGKAIILSRFVPIVRTFAPFVAGVGEMQYRQFLSYNIIGGLIWVTLFLFGGYFFGNLPVVKQNFEIVILGIVVVSIIPMLVEWLRSREGH